MIIEYAGREQHLPADACVDVDGLVDAMLAALGELVADDAVEQARVDADAAREQEASCAFWKAKGEGR